MEMLQEKTIWAFWHTGADSLSPFLQVCMNSWQLKHCEWNFVLLDLDNIWCYLQRDELPSTFQDIKRASLQSDVIRLAVLAKFGGVYVDVSSLALEPVADIAWERVCEGSCLVGFRAPDLISDFVSSWFLSAKAQEPILVEWSRQFNRLMERFTDDCNIHKDAFFDGLDLNEYLCLGHLASTTNPPTLWVDHLVVNVVLKAVLDRNEELRMRLWSSACLIAEGDLQRSPISRSAAQQHVISKGTYFHDTSRISMSSNLLLQDPDFTTRLVNLPMVQFFNSGSPFAGLGMDELLRSPCVLSCLVRKSLGLLVDHSRQATQWPSVPNLQNLPLVRRNCPPFTWEPEGKFQKPADLDAASVAIATIATDKFYAVGAAGLARSIKQKSGMQDGTRLICIVPRSIDSESSQLLAAEGWEVLMAESFDPQEFPQLFQELENPNYQYCYLKLHLWDLQQHCGRLQRVLYIDSDALVVGDLQKVLYAAETEPPNGGVSMAPDYDWRTGLSLRCNEVASMKKVSTAMSLDSTVAETLGIPKSKVLSAESSEGAEGQLMRSKSSYGKSVAASAFKPDTYCNAGVLLLRPSVQVYKTLMGS